jgi:predicted acyltransferase
MHLCVRSHVVCVGVLQRFAVSYFFCSLLLIFAPHYQMYLLPPLSLPPPSSSYSSIYMIVPVYDDDNSPDAPTAFTNLRLHLVEWYNVRFSRIYMID